MAKSKWDRVCIVGVGLIGGSIGMGLKQRNLANTVVGVGRNSARLKEAIAQNVIDEFTISLKRGVKDCDLIIVCTPPEMVVPLIQEAVKHCPADCLITDAASTKYEIVKALQESLPAETRFVGSHPLAGGHNSGFQHGSADLLVNRKVIVTPVRGGREADTKEVVNLWQGLGAEVVRKAATAHDEQLAATSHMPHLLAYALALSTKGSVLPMVGPGWLDTTRIAKADHDLWTQIFRENRQNVLDAAKHFQSKFDALVEALESGDDQQLKRLLKKGKHQRDTAETVAS